MPYARTLHPTDIHKPSEKLSLFYTNSRHINNKFIELQHILSLFHHDLICLSETWLNHDICANFISTYDYICFQCNRTTRGGGVLILCKSILYPRLHKIYLENGFE